MPPSALVLSHLPDMAAHTIDLSRTPPVSGVLVQIRHTACAHNRGLISFNHSLRAILTL